jgi:hypothetical protein
MSLQTTEAPAATGTQAPTPAAAESRSSQGSAPGRPAVERDRLSGAALRSEFAASRRSKREAVQAQKPVATHPVNPDPAPASGESPAPEKPAAGQQANATSAPAETETSAVAAILNGEPAAEGEPKEPAEGAEAKPGLSEEILDDPAALEALSEEILDDPAALEALSEDQIKAIPNAEMRRLVRRNQRLAARATKAEAKLQEMQRQAAVAQPAPQHEPASGVEFHPEVARIDAKLNQVQRLLDWLDANPDGGDYADDAGGVKATVSPDQVRRAQRSAVAELARLESQRETRISGLRQQDEQARRQALESAKQAYPWLAKPESDQYALAAQVLASAPFLRQHPEWPIWLADAVEGRMARLARAAAPKPAAPRPTPPRVPPPGGAQPPKVDPMVAQLAEAEAAFEKSGKASDFKRVETIKRQMRRRVS